MPPESDATPAYRGYRLQALYTLFRILGSTDETLIFQPEGQEDLAIFGASNRLLEAIQVKAHKDDLTLASFSPNKPASFFYRAALLRKVSSEVKIGIVSYGSIGRELLQATITNGRERERIAYKISEQKFLSKDEAKKLIADIELTTVDENELTRQVYEHLRASLVGVEPERAFEMLNFWLYICAENKYKITRHDVIERLNNVGQFISERAAHHKEWFTSIVPLENIQIEGPVQHQLSDEFYRGISTRYEHILANLDVPRPRIMQEISQEFEQTRVVIIHGASGQGKSTVAYRYLHEAFPEEWRFRIKLVGSREHALSIATALIAQAEAIGIPIAVYLDVSATDRDWPDLVRQLAVHQNIRVLVTIREEDLQRASIAGTDFQFSSVPLSFDRHEAEELYQALSTQRIPVAFVNFEEAWHQFGEHGPLLEFVYLVTQGASLRERLTQQVQRLTDDVREGRVTATEVELLRLVSVASAFEARLHVKSLVTSLGLPAAQRTFQLFEKEYLLRVSDDGALVFGLHPIRSTVLADILTDPIFSPWAESASRCLQCMEELDVESFLLHAFARRGSDDVQVLLQTLASYHPATWGAIAGVTRALLWLGIHEYVGANRTIIQEAFKESGSGWLFLLDFDVADATPGAAASFWENVGHLASNERRSRAQALQAQQSDKKQLFARATTWLSSRTQAPRAPRTTLDWSGFAEASFWLGKLHVAWPVVDWISENDLAQALATVPLEIWADVIRGWTQRDDPWFASWLANNRATLLRRFREEQLVVVFEDDGQKVTAHFIVAIDRAGNSQADAERVVRNTRDRLHDEALQRIDVMRGLFPDRELYACQGYGHRLWTPALPYDSTQKTGIPRSTLPPFWLTSINGTFRGLATRMFRPGTWQEYALLVFDLRKMVLQALEQLDSSMGIYFKKQSMVTLLGALINADEWTRYQELLDRSPLLPSSALDEWGFVDELMSGAAEQETQQALPLLRRKGLVITLYKPLSEAFKQYDRPLFNFFRQAVHTMTLHPVLGKGATSQAAKNRVLEQASQLGVKREFVPLATTNFADAVKALRGLQQQFRLLLSKFVSISELDTLERREQSAFLRVWSMWYFFSTRPSQIMQNAAQQCLGHLTDAIHKTRSKLRKELRSLSSTGLEIKLVSDEVRWDHEPTLWITIDGTNAVEVYNAVERVIAAIRQAVQTINDAELRRYMLDFYWPYVAIVPLVRGKALTPSAWRLALPVLLQEGEPGWWNFAQQPIPTDAMSKLQLTLWNLPQLQNGIKFMQAVTDLSVFAAHIRDIKTLPDLDDDGAEQVQQYISSLSSPLSTAFEAVLDSEEILANTFNHRSQAERERRPNLVAAMEALLELHNYVLPTADFENEAVLNLDAVAAWADLLEESQKYALLAYLFWMSDVLDEIASQ